ncbi:hypothetical protein Tco_1273819 [Tanacetum coccineum]
MTTLKFTDTHNMVVFLSKAVESEWFKQIVDFLNAHTIRYALTVNPTIYTSCIEQFWATVKAKTVNGEVQLQALVDGKKIIVTEASVRSDLQLNDEEGMDCLPNATIFEELTRIGCEKLSQKLTFYKAFFSPQWKFLINTILQCLSAKTTAWNEFSSTMASAIICLATNQKFNFSKYIFESMVKNLDNADEAVSEEMDDSLERAATTATSLDAEQDRGNINKTQSKATPNKPSSLGTSSCGSPRHQETMGDTIAQTRSENVSKLSNAPLLARVIDLENTKTAQAQEITSLKLRFKKLEKKGGSRTHKLKRLYMVGRSIRIVSSDEASLGDQEDASKQGRKIDDIDKDVEITLVDETQGRYGDDIMFDVSDLAALQDLKAVKPKVKGIVFKEPVESTTIISSQQRSQAKIQARVKKMIEPEPVKKLSKKYQLKLDEEVAQRLQSKFDEQERIEREKAKKEVEANIALKET